MIRRSEPITGGPHGVKWLHRGPAGADLGAIATCRRRARGTAYEIEHTEGPRGHPVENWYEFSGIGEVRQLYAGDQGYRP